MSPLPGSSPIESRPTRGASRAKRCLANTAPIWANCTSHSGWTSALAPASSRTVGVEPGTGIGVAIAGRLTPLIRPMRSSAAAIVAPVLPAEIIAEALPSRTASAARTSVESFLRRIAWAGSSSIATTSAAGINGRSPRVPPGRADRPARPGSLGRGLDGAGDDLARRPVAAHGVDGDRQHRLRKLGDGCGATAIKRRRWRRGSCTSRRRGRPCAGAWRCRTAGTMLRAGAASFHAPARRLRDFDFDFFFFGTAIGVSISRARKLGWCRLAATAPRGYGPRRAVSPRRGAGRGPPSARRARWGRTRTDRPPGRRRRSGRGPGQSGRHSGPSGTAEQDLFADHRRQVDLAVHDREGVVRRCRAATR